MRRLLLALAAVCVGCMSSAEVRFFGANGGAPTCDAVCDYYLSCKGMDSAEVRTACTQECTDIFYEDGEPDTRSLRQFQQLGCSDAIAFVEGTSGRPPGVRASN